MSNNGDYHNTKFKATVEAHGLHIEKDKRYGWSVKALTDDTAAWLAAQPGMADITASRRTLLEVTTPPTTAARKPRP